MGVLCVKAPQKFYFEIEYFEKWTVLKRCSNPGKFRVELYEMPGWVEIRL